MNDISSAEFGRRYATRFPFVVFKPALKHGPTLDCRYRGKITLVTARALDWKRAFSLDCRYRGRSASGPLEGCSVIVLMG
jgi:hypothetical protein